MTTNHFNARFVVSDRILFVVVVAGALILTGGCQANSGRAVKMQQQSGRMNRNTDYGYFAICKTESPGGHEGVWKGPLVQAKERAMQDALDHNKENPGHRATVQHY
jgi:hypothetical protein